MELLAEVCYLIIGFCIIMYVLLDGFDLGIALLFPFLSSEHRDITISSILPIWDGNQTWLVFGIAIFYGAFPQAFSLIMPALYLPLFIMVMALLLRGISFEFRLKEKKHRKIWDIIFALSAVLITFIQGLLVGAFVGGFKLTAENHLFINLFTPFNVICGVALLFGYTLLGSTWIIMKCEDKLQECMYFYARISLWMIGLFLSIISIWSPFINNSIWERWFGEYFYQVLILPCLTTGLFFYFDDCIRRRYVYRLYFLSILIFICSYIGLGISTWPYIVPHLMTIWQISSPPSSQIFLLVGVLLLLPVLLAYTFYAYYIFRGKTKDIFNYE